MLAEKVYNLNSFKHQYEALLTLSVCDTIPNLSGIKINQIYYLE